MRKKQPKTEQMMELFTTNNQKNRHVCNQEDRSGFNVDEYFIL